MVSTFRADRLLALAGESGKKNRVKLALFGAYFSDDRDVSDPEVEEAYADVPERLLVDRPVA